MTGCHINSDRLTLERVRQSLTESEDGFKKVLIFVLFIVPMWSSKMFRCYNDKELQAAAHRKLRTHYLQPTEAPRTTAHSSSYSCPLDLYKTPLSEEQRERSLSPWRFVTHMKEDHFPSTYVAAQCLCSGCIQLKNGKGIEDYDYNSVPIVQNRVFLKRSSVTIRRLTV